MQNEKSSELSFAQSRLASKGGANLVGKLALVTGASRGIGKAIALALAADGANLLLVGRDPVPLEAVKSEIESVGVACRALACDLLKTEKLSDLLDAAAAECGPIDILVNNAGFYKVAAVLNHPPALWDETIAVNLSASFHLCRYVLAGMMARRWGRIINLASVSGKLGEPYGAAYSASKFGLIGLTQSLALEVAKFEITVNAICPGWVLTEMALKQLNDKQWCDLTAIDPSQSVEIARLSVPQERFIGEDEIAALCLFLCSNQARGITGQSINICGGLSLR